jgi:hypothetical protein
MRLIRCWYLKPKNFPDFAHFAHYRDAKHYVYGAVLESPYIGLWVDNIKDAVRCKGPGPIDVGSVFPCP